MGNVVIYRKSNSRDFWREAELLRGRKRGSSAAVEGLTNGDNIADAFSRYYDDLYNSVDFDHSDMRELYIYIDFFIRTY